MDDKYWNSEFNKKEGFTGPRFKKEDKYPAYSYSHEAFQYVDDNGVVMVAFSLRDEKGYSHVTKHVYDTLIAPNLKP